MKYWTDKQWDALLLMTGDSGSFSVSMSIGDVHLNRMSGVTRYELEYPTHIVSLRRHVPPNDKELDTLRYMYEMYMSI